MKHLLRLAFTLLLAAVLTAGEARAQFTTGSQTGNTGTTTQPKSKSDTVYQAFSFKTLFRGLARKQPMQIGYAFGASAVVPGLGQYYNKDYWKIPVIYAGLGTGIGLGIHYNNLYNQSVTEAAGIEGASPNQKYKNISTACFVGAGLVYWAQLMDVTVSYKINTTHSAGKATLYSMLCPGAGQAYNKEYWKIPIYTGGVAAGVYCWTFFNTQYTRYKRIHNEATNPDVPYDGPIPAQTALWYRDYYRRYRDLSIVGTMLIYILNIIDANVFAYMGDFDISDNLALKLEPAVINPVSIDLANNATALGQDSAVGFRINLTF